MTVNYEKITHNNYNTYDPIYNNVERRKETVSVFDKYYGVIRK